MESIASALHPIQAIVWGERAITALGVRIICDHSIFVVADTDLKDAIERLRSAGFRDCRWSYGTRNPARYEGAIRKRIYRQLIRDYNNMDQHSARFLFPPGPQLGQVDQDMAKVVLLPSSYAHIQTSDSSLMRDGNLLWPSAALLVRSFVQTLVREPVAGMWTSSLDMWTISYVYGQIDLDVPDDVLDSCDDEEAKAWFNRTILRFGGGMDRITCTKRLGRVGYDESLARQRTAA
ncbi:hypothetical protein QQZ08_000957 [Neonectria magnoliae]|uniref:Uncharacterized protein n=1 Tax=Neonectria magnoliae TaxID=2732573 RepID=A0ABR1IH69_9HYPO